MFRYLPISIIPFLFATYPGHAQSPSNAKRLAVIGYYAGRATAVDSFPTEKLTHIIFSFCHLNGNRLWISNARDSATLQTLVALKTEHPQLKVIVSLGGWGGCKTCPEVFASDTARRQFVASAKDLLDQFNADGIDLDWEYPALENIPGYPYTPEDKDHFTEVIRLLRKTLGRKKEVSFAAGGFVKYLETSIDWKQVAPLVNYINLMTYDLVGGYANRSGHHTPLYSTPDQLESTDRAVRWLDSAGVPLSKVAIGMAFYARLFAVEDTLNNGLYRPCRFFRGVSYRNESTTLSPDSGYIYHWDSTAGAPYKFNAGKRIFATFDDTASIREKTTYAVRKGLGGVMFWQLTDDSFFSGGLLDVIDNTKTTLAKGRKR
jgi:chitinase